MTVTDHPLLYFAEDREAAAVITMTHFIINKESALLIKHNAKVKVYSGSGSTEHSNANVPSSLYLQLHATTQSPTPTAAKCHVHFYHNVHSHRQIHCPKHGTLYFGTNSQHKYSVNRELLYIK